VRAGTKQVPLRSVSSEVLETTTCAVLSFLCLVSDRNLFFTMRCT